MVNGHEVVVGGTEEVAEVGVDNAAMTGDGNAMAVVLSDDRVDGVDDSLLEALRVFDVRPGAVLA